MLGKRSRPSFGKLAGAFRSGIVDLATSPRSSLECKMNPSPSPRRLKNYEQGGVGLGIVMALDKPSHNHGSSGGEVLAKHALCGSGSSIRSNPSPIPVSPVGGSARNKRGKGGGYNDDSVDMMEGLEEEFTFVTSHGPNKSVTTRVYYNDGEYGTNLGHEKKTGFSSEVGRSFGVFRISPVRLFDDSRRSSDSDFLSYCHLCRKNLHGKDIYMYRGEKAFCSPECRQCQIVIDESKEQCRSDATRSGEVPTSTYGCTTTGSGSGSGGGGGSGQIFSPGIVAV